MSDFVYRARKPDELKHMQEKGLAGKVKYESRYRDKKAQVTRRTSGYYDTKSIIGRGTDTKYGKYKAGSYKSKYYDPVARHERYLKERASLGIGTGGSGGGKGGSGGGKGGSGGGGRSASVQNAINKLREESSLNTEAQQEATRRKILDLKEDLKAQIDILRNRKGDEEGLNVAEIRGKISTIRKNIENAGGDYRSWVKKEQEALNRKIAKLSGTKYDPEGDKKRIEQKKATRDKQVKSRADAIYKRKYAK